MSEIRHVKYHYCSWNPLVGVLMALLVSWDRRVIVEKERKKQSSGAGWLLLEVSSSQSGNSKPSPPLSLVVNTTPKGPWTSDIWTIWEARNQISQATVREGCKFSEPSLFHFPFHDLERSLSSSCDSPTIQVFQSWIWLVMKIYASFFCNFF